MSLGKPQRITSSIQGSLVPTRLTGYRLIFRGLALTHVEKKEEAEKACSPMSMMSLPNGYTCSVLPTCLQIATLEPACESWAKKAV